MQEPEKVERVKEKYGWKKENYFQKKKSQKKC